MLIVVKEAGRRDVSAGRFGAFQAGRLGMVELGDFVVKNPGSSRFEAGRDVLGGTKKLQ